MNHLLIELLEEVEIEKDGCQTIFFNKGVLFKIVYDSESHFLVKADDDFTFTLAKLGKNQLWRCI